MFRVYLCAMLMQWSVSVCVCLVEREIWMGAECSTTTLPPVERANVYTYSA